MSVVCRSFASKPKKKKASKPKVNVSTVKKTAAGKPNTEPLASTMSEEEYTKMVLTKFRKKNAITGGVIMSLVLSVYFGSMYLVNQDPLDDVLEEAKV